MGEGRAKLEALGLNERVPSNPNERIFSHARCSLQMVGATAAC